MGNIEMAAEFPQIPARKLRKVFPGELQGIDTAGFKGKPGVYRRLFQKGKIKEQAVAHQHILSQKIQKLRQDLPDLRRVIHLFLADPRDLPGALRLLVEKGPGSFRQGLALHLLLRGKAPVLGIGQGKGLYEVNTVVDVNNLISIESGFSVGSYDAARMREDLVFRIGEAGETYKGIGKEEIKIDALPVLADEQGAIGSSTSDSERAMITEEAQEVLTLIYSFSDNQDLEKALESGRRYLEQYAKASGIQSWIVE